MSKGDKNRTSDREAYRETMERLRRYEEEAKKTDEKWSGLARLLKFIQGDDDEST